ncbi:MAG: DEAD/DEAH box helicase, partial [Candidatus Hodarchaeales archaeon]
ANKIRADAPPNIVSLDEFADKFEIPLEDIPNIIKKIVKFSQHQIVDYRFFPSQDGVYGGSTNILEDDNLIDYLSRKKIDSLYQFQEEAYHNIMADQDICIVAPTGNGKTEAFLLPSLMKIKENAGYGVQILIIYPIKALAKDQLRKIEELTNILGLEVKLFDGDVSDYQRKKIFSNPPEVLVTNPDIIHYHLGIGKNFHLFQNLLANLKILIIDEVHTYSGTFGSNMYYILRRLERLSSHQIQFIAASATIANAGEFTSRLFNKPVTIVNCKTGKRGRLHFLMIAPFEETPTIKGMVHLLNSIKSDGKILAFQDSHRNAESLYQQIGISHGEVGIHRAGLAKKVREEVEQQFRNGNINLLIATPTLELGVDIGDLEIVVTPPISINRTIQRIGRAGRKGQDAIAIIHLNSDDPISQYYYENPDQYFQEAEEIYFDPANPIVIEHQLLTASNDKPLKDTEFVDQKPIIDNLKKRNLIKEGTDGRFIPTEAGISKIRKYSIRGTNHEITIKAYGEGFIGKRSMPLAMLELYPGAIYFAGGKKYIVDEFRFNGFTGYANLKRSKDYVRGRTYPLTKTTPKVLVVHSPIRRVLGLDVALVGLKLTRSVFGYILQSPEGNQSIKYRDPNYYSSQSTGLLIQLPFQLIKENISQEDYIASIHTLLHLLIHASLPLIGGQIQEIGGLAILPQGYILLFDSNTGMGVSEMLISHFEELFERARIILNCTCKKNSGCPKCCFLTYCSQKNTLLDRSRAQQLLSLIIKGDRFPLGTDYNEGRSFLY